MAYLTYISRKKRGGGNVYSVFCVIIILLFCCFSISFERGRLLDLVSLPMSTRENQCAQCGVEFFSAELTHSRQLLAWALDSIPYIPRVCWGHTARPLAAALCVARAYTHTHTHRVAYMEATTQAHLGIAWFNSFSLSLSSYIRASSICPVCVESFVMWSWRVLRLPSFSFPPFLLSVCPSFAFFPIIIRLLYSTY